MSKYKACLLNYNIVFDELDQKIDLQSNIGDINYLDYVFFGN